MLYIVATPIGNLEDITLRALNTLFSVQVILAEDTRKTLALLRHFQKPGQTIPKLISFYEENEIQRIPEIISQLKAGNDFALVTNAGTPTISDPGFKLVRECRKQEIPITSLPGAFSPAVALSASGLPTDKFIFLGFPSPKPSHRQKLFQNVQKACQYLPATVIFFESPHRLLKSLTDLQSVFGDIEIVLARELTKKYEEFQSGKISLLIEKLSHQPPKGEFIVLFATS